MLQDPAVKPPDFELDMLACSRSTTDRRQKPNANSEVLKCPRCDSLNTKFCYYNNYSLAQPRHFCKSCRRYWTKGGALRNVPVGGGCRKNKRVKQRTCIDPSSLVPLGESASSMLANINSANCSGLLPGFPGPSSTSFSDLSGDGNMLSLAFSRIQESLRLGEQSGAVSSGPGIFGVDNGSGQTRTGLLNSKCIPQSQMSSMANNYDHMGYTNAAIKQEEGAVIYNGSEFDVMFEAPTHISTGSATATLASLEDQLSKFSVPVESLNSCNLAAQLRSIHHHKLARQLMTEVEGGADRGFNGLPAFEDESRRRHSKGKPIYLDGRSLSVDWQPEGMTESLFEPAADQQNFWGNSGWTDIHPLAGSAAGSAML